MKKRILALTFSLFGLVGFLNASCVTATSSNTTKSQTSCYKDGSNEHFYFHDGKLISIRIIE